MFGVEDSENEAGAMQDALTEFGKANGIDITYVGRRDFEQQINAQVLGGNPPDIAAFPQPGKLKQFAQDGKLQKVPDDVVAATKQGWADSYLAFSNVDGTQYGVPIKSDLKSLVWYVPSVWKAKGYEVPTTLTEFNTLVDKMIANGDTPLCVGIESGTATGWPFTDWVEELVLRQKGIDYYNQWVNHEVPFDDQPVVDAFNRGRRSGRLLEEERQRVLLGRVDRRHRVRRQRAVARRGQVHDAPPGELLQRLLPRGHASSARATGQVSTFYFPADSGHPVLVGGISAGAFRDAPEVWKVMQYLGSAEFANARQDGAEPSAWAAGSRGSSPGTRRPTDEVGTARAGLHQARSRRPARRRSTPLTRCRPKSGRARSGRKGRRSSTATRTPRRPPPTSRPRGRS